MSRFPSAQHHSCCSQLCFLLHLTNWMTQCRPEKSNFILGGTGNTCLGQCSQFLRNRTWSRCCHSIRGKFEMFVTFRRVKRRILQYEESVESLKCLFHYRLFRFSIILYCTIILIVYILYYHILSLSWNEFYEWLMHQIHVFVFNFSWLPSQLDGKVMKKNLSAPKCCCLDLQCLKLKPILVDIWFSYFFNFPISWPIYTKTSVPLHFISIDLFQHQGSGCDVGNYRFGAKASFQAEYI